MKHKILMIPGPIEVSKEVLSSLAKPLMPHYGEEFVKIYKEIISKLKTIFRTRNDIVILAATSSGGMEASVISTVERGNKVLVCQNGFFGNRFKEIVEAVGAISIPVEANAGEPISINSVIRKLNRHHNIDTLTIVHNETSTGVVNPVKEICEVASSRNILTIVDSVSGFGGTNIDVDNWNIDIAITGTQKCLEAIPGLCILTISNKAWKRMKERHEKIYSWYLNLLNIRRYQDYWQNWRPAGPNTAPVSLYVALNKALDRIMLEGMDNRIKRHENIASALRYALREIGLELLADDHYASKTLTAVKLPAGVNGEELRKTISNDFNILLAGGLGENKNSIIRIGHMGFTAQEKFVIPTLKSLESTLPNFGFHVEQGMARKAFKKKLHNQ